MKNFDTGLQSLQAGLAEIQAASLTMNDRFIAEAALLSRELLLSVMQKHHCTLKEVTALDIVDELKQRSPLEYSVPAIPAVTSCGA